MEIPFFKTKLRLMGFVLIFSVLLMFLKFGAYIITSSQAILTDALESIINVVAGAFAFISLYFSEQPRDLKHPYGHGKLEYVSVGVEGSLISVAGIYIVWEAIHGMVSPQPIHELGIGIFLVFLSGLFNGLIGGLLVRTGKKQQSALLTADGKHLLTDTVSSGVLLVGLTVIKLTGLLWLDGLLSLLLGIYIVVTGFKMLKTSVGVLIDEADYETLTQVVETLNANRHSHWIDVHNLRVQKFGANLHIDCHLTLPWYATLEQTHLQTNNLEQTLKAQFGKETELFVHADPCIPPTSCSVCPIANCPERKQQMQERVEWTLENLLPNSKHSSL